MSLAGLQVSNMGITAKHVFRFSEQLVVVQVPWMNVSVNQFRKLRETRIPSHGCQLHIQFVDCHSIEGRRGRLRPGFQFNYPGFNVASIHFEVILSRRSSRFASSRLDPEHNEHQVGVADM